MYKEWQKEITEALGLNPNQVVRLEILMTGDSPFLAVNADLLISDTDDFYRVIQKFQYKIVGEKE